MADVVGVDFETDIALLKRRPRGPAREIRLGSSAQLRIGDVVLAIGNPYGLDQDGHPGHRQRDRRARARAHDVRGFHPDGRGDQYQATRAARWSTVTASWSASTQRFSTQDAGRRVSASRFRWTSYAAWSIKSSEHGRVIRGYMGLVPDDLTSVQRNVLGLGDNARGILVVEVYEGGPADRAGLAPGDVILTINDQPIVSTTAGAAGRRRNEPGRRSRDFRVARRHGLRDHGHCGRASRRTAAADCSPRPDGRTLRLRATGVGG